MQIQQEVHFTEKCALVLQVGPSKPYEQGLLCSGEKGSGQGLIMWAEAAAPRGTSEAGR